MKIIMIEATAEELKANRTILDGVADAVNDFMSSFANMRVTPEQVGTVLLNMGEEGEEGE